MGWDLRSAGWQGQEDHNGERVGGAAEWPRPGLSVLQHLHSPTALFADKVKQQGQGKVGMGHRHIRAPGSALGGEGIMSSVVLGPTWWVSSCAPASSKHQKCVLHHFSALHPSSASTGVGPSSYQ